MSAQESAPWQKCRQNSLFSSFFHLPIVVEFPHSFSLIIYNTLCTRKVNRCSAESMRKAQRPRRKRGRTFAKLLSRNQPFRLSSTATATATVAPTMGLLPMPKKPIIALSYCLVFLALLSFSYSQFSIAALHVDKVWTRICPQSNLTYLYNIILLHNYKTRQKYLSAILESYRLFFSSLL